MLCANDRHVLHPIEGIEQTMLLAAGTTRVRRNTCAFAIWKDDRAVDKEVIGWDRQCFGERRQSMRPVMATACDYR